MRKLQILFALAVLVLALTGCPPTGSESPPEQVFSAPLLIPDYINYRVVLLNDTSGAGWAELAFPSGFSDPRPTDADADASLRIYVSTYYDYVTGGIVRLNSLDDPNPVPLVENQGVTAIAIDRERNILYYIADASDAFLLYSIDLGNIGAGSTLIDIAPEELSIPFDTWGLAVGDGGLLYLITYAGVVQLDPSLAPGSRWLDSFAVPNGAAPWDLAFLGGYLWVSTWDSAAPQVARIDVASGSGLAIGGVPVDPMNPQPGELFGPNRFVSLAGSRVVVIDEDSNAASLDRIVGFDDISGSGWQAFGSSGNGVGEFYFYIWD